MNLITSGVMQGLVGAAAGKGLADVSMGVYRQASARGDAGGMDRAAGYASGSMHSANASAEEAQKALEAAQAQARARQSAERRDAIEMRREEARRAREAVENREAETPKGGEPTGTIGNAQTGTEYSGDAQISGDAENALSETLVFGGAGRPSVPVGASAALDPGSGGGGSAAARYAPPAGTDRNTSGRMLRVTA